MIIYKQVIVKYYRIHPQNMGYDRFSTLFKDFPGT